MLYAAAAAKHQTTRKKDGLRRVPGLLRGLRLLRGRLPRLLRLRHEDQGRACQSRRGPRREHVGDDPGYRVFVGRAVLPAGEAFGLLRL